MFHVKHLKGVKPQKLGAEQWNPCLLSSTPGALNLGWPKETKQEKTGGSKYSGLIRERPISSSGTFSLWVWVPETQTVVGRSCGSSRLDLTGRYFLLVPLVRKARPCLSRRRALHRAQGSMDAFAISDRDLCLALFSAWISCRSNLCFSGLTPNPIQFQAMFHVKHGPPLNLLVSEATSPKVVLQPSNVHLPSKEDGKEVCFANSSQ